MRVATPAQAAAQRLREQLKPSAVHEWTPATGSGNTGRRSSQLERVRELKSQKMSRFEIARELGITVAGVKYHLKAIAAEDAEKHG